MPSAHPTQDLIDQLIARVTDLLPGIDVARYPGRPQDYRLAHPQGAVLISYPGGRDAPSPTGRTMISTDTWMLKTLHLMLVNRGLWELDGILDHLDRLRAGLIGWRPQGSMPLAFRSERLLNAEAGIWWYGADYEALCPAGAC